MEIILQGHIVRRSQNLRGVLDYARDTSRVESVTIIHEETPAGYPVLFTFRDGATCSTNFADLSVAAEFLRSRRSWGGDSMKITTERVVPVTTTFKYE